MQRKQKSLYTCTREIRVNAVISDKKKDRLKQVKIFKCLGSMISENGGCEEEVRHRVRAGWGKWREISGLVCDKRMPIMLKTAVYIGPNIVVGTVLMYGSETWALRKAVKNLL